jgi:hypothetical protein
MHPNVRSGLLVESTDDEVVVVDEQNHEVCALDPTAACVFIHADGTRDVAALLAVLQDSVDPSATAEWVWTTLDRLADAGLLEARVTPPAGSSRLDRRSLLRKGAVGSAAFGAGVVVTALIPTAAAASSVPDNQEQLDKQGEQQGKIDGEQAAKEGSDKGEQQGKETGDKLGEQASKEGADKGEQLTKEMLSKNPTP